MSTAAHYYLSADLYVCLSDARVVLLDLRRDKYLALDQDASSLLQPVVSALGSQEGICEAAPEPDVRAVLADLRASGILCTDPPPRARHETSHPLIRPQRAIHPLPPYRECVTTRQTARYIMCVVRAKSALRLRSIYRIVLAERRKASARPLASRMLDATRVTELCSVYSRLRVIATGPRQCLFDSFALKLFLAKYRVFPDWIFGVRLNPFAAHCWLQHGDTLVNDSLDAVRRFTPIMAV